MADQMTKRLTDERLREWRESLKDVTPGSWRMVGNRTECKIWASTAYIAQEVWTENGLHIARCDPQTIGGMIEELLAARKSVRVISNTRIRNAALDEAAKVAQKHLVHPTAEMIAGAILALKTPEREDG